MQKDLFIHIFNQSIPFLSDNWKRRYGKLLSKEHWNTIGTRAFTFAFENVIYHNPLPIFKEEIITDYSMHYRYFDKLKFLGVEKKDLAAKSIAKIIEETPIASLLIILGQRKTSATITDENGIPPLKEQLLRSCFESYNDQICKATRAREKHISRNEESFFWGEVKGSPIDKERTTKITVRKIIQEKTWWNVFTHYKHGVVYEVRVASGEGIRWKKNELDFIGFLEPFE